MNQHIVDFGLFMQLVVNKKNIAVKIILNLHFLDQLMLQNSRMRSDELNMDEKSWKVWTYYSMTTQYADEDHVMRSKALERG